MCYCCKVNIIMVDNTSTHIMEAMRPCSCCLVRAPVKNMTTPHIHLGKTEIYSAMLIECLNIHLDLSMKECGICETCVGRLRDANDFKQQVQRCQVELQTLHNEELKADEMTISTTVRTSDDLPESKPDEIMDTAAEDTPETVGKLLEYAPYDQTEAVNLSKDKLLGIEVVVKTERVAETGDHLLENEPVAKIETAYMETRDILQEHKLTAMKTEPVDGTSDHSSDEDDLIVLSDLLDKNGIHNNSYDMESITEKLEDEGCEIDDCKPLLVTIGAVSIPLLQLHPGAREQLSTTCSVPLARVDVTRLTHPCLTCRLTFLTEASRDVHTRHCGNTPNNMKTFIQCENRVKLPCPVCYRSFLSNKRLKRHIKKVHLVENGTYACDTCGKEFTNKLILIKHIKNHMTQTLYYCDVCSIGCFGKKLLKQHKIIHSLSRRYICEICNKQFNEKCKLQAHKRTHHIGVEQPYVCEICDRRFPDAITLKKHKLSHSSLKPFACKICYKQYSRLYALQKHQLIHHNIANSNIANNFNCQECHIKFSQLNDLILHKQKSHADQCNVCFICQKQFLRKRDLSLHMATHTGQQQISCEVCSKKFLHRKHLVRHQRLHSGEKPYTCDLCLKQFALRESIVSHIKKHMGLKTYKCEVCNKMFINSRALSRHNRKKHKKRKSHCCEICETNFSKKSYLVRHLQKHMNRET